MIAAQKPNERDAEQFASLSSGFWGPKAKISKHVEKSYFQSLKINFHVMKIYFQALKINFHVVKIVLCRVE